MKIALSADEHTPSIDTITHHLTTQGHQVHWLGRPEDNRAPSWPKAAQYVAQAVTDGRCDEGIILCWTGTGVSIAANKIANIRAALCTDAETAKGAKLWNNANVLCLSIRLLSAALAKEILDAWLNTTYVPDKEKEQHLQHLEPVWLKNDHTS